MNQDQIQDAIEDVKTWIGRSPASINELHYEGEAGKAFDSLVAQIATLTAERDEARKELAALRSAPQMAEVNALWAMWLKTRPPDDEPIVEDLVDLARQTILAYEREKRRADEAEKEARRVECCTCGHEMVEVDGQFGCEHCDHEYDQTCECPNCHQTRERESAQSRIATLTSERDELESMRKEDIKAVLCLQSEIERLLAKVEHKKQQLAPTP